MKSIVLSTCLSVLLFAGIPALAQQAGFTAPDTVCINEPVHLFNTSVDGTTFYWNFCAGNLYQPPTGVNFGDFGGTLQTPVFLDMAQEGGNYYAFVTNNNAPALVRLSFGNSLLNTPTAENLGDFGGQIPPQTEGLRIVKDAAGWHIVVVGGGVVSSPGIAVIDFGSSLTNTPTCTNWGNIGNLAYPTDLFTFQEGGNWYGMALNSDNNTVTRLSFGTSFGTAPTGVNLGNIGNLDFPTGTFIINVNGNWHMFITNTRGNTITRLDFGNSLLNTPVAVNMGNPGGLLNEPRDIYVFSDCGGTFALVANGNGDDLLRLDFAGNDITGNVTASSYGNIGGFRYPHSLSTVFRVQDNLYTFVANALNNTLTRVSFGSCTNSSIPSSTLYTAPVYAYSQPGTYTVTLLMDEGLPTQQSVCRNIVVMPLPTVDLGPDQITCNNTPVLLDAGTGNSHYTWSDLSTGHTLQVTHSATYSVTVSNGGGCTTTDEVEVVISPAINVAVDATPVDCAHPTGSIAVEASGGIPPFTYSLNNVDMGTQDHYTGLTAGVYNIDIRDAVGCTITRTVDLTAGGNNSFSFTATPSWTGCAGGTDGAIRLTVTSGQPPVEFALGDLPYQNVTTFDHLTPGNYTIYGRAGSCADTVSVTVTAPVPIDMTVTPRNETCGRADGALIINATGGTPPYTFEINGVTATNADMINLAAGDYDAKVIDANGCEANTFTTLENLDIPPVSITNNDTTIVIGDRVQLHAINAPDYLWMPGAGLNCLNCPSPVAQPYQTTTYIVTTRTGQNCITADTVTIFVDLKNSMFIPTAFTPNKDGSNDLFRVKAQGVAAFRMVIYNRWGEFIFRSDDVAKGWDGLYKDQPQPAGGYVYVIDYIFFEDLGKVHRQKGTVMLVR